MRPTFIKKVIVAAILVVCTVISGLWLADARRSISESFVKFNQYDRLCEDLSRACKDGDLKKAKLALRANDDKPCELQPTTLVSAVESKNVSIINLILDAGADPDNNKPVFIAAAGGDMDIMKLLISRGAKISPEGPGNDNALVFAADAGQVDIVKYLLTHIGPDDGYHLQRALKFTGETLKKCEKGDAKSKKLTKIIGMLQHSLDTLNNSSKSK